MRKTLVVLALLIASILLPFVSLASSHMGGIGSSSLPPAPDFIGGFDEVEAGRKAAGVVDGSLLDLAFKILRTLLVFLGVIALAALIWGGVLYIISLGNDQDIQKAKKIIIYALVGIIVIMLAGLLVNVVINAFAIVP